MAVSLLGVEEIVQTSFWSARRQKGHARWRSGRDYGPIST
jgi:hypothetical protein